ncbi:MAG: pyrroloquinoline quinone biosynthesis protein PqqB [Hyphomicrobium sp.]|uniref:pyrroloquinoline quinone biosynthesis protein PqqB n=1 Tax=Hyphomicrobium sp. TaxID=82 RepID=UPI0013265D0F|nr:pyrroloquinoline quinone biosynthesis protein PqqB [Hyphomicrobium sp.]KAB2940514.1 MAG: pyrroloquinoline quinone biosynthesis protein PqqB [Hyphomicrobium sp.]MBZ0210872.1 pyrroloquinoline quinone biosynthesis protein PqqB [Hyphomicrobium sp.]
MLIKILGSAAGGGFPQWNCNCRNCAAVRSGAPGFRARTQSSLAVSRDGVNWALLNASPDLRQQINATPQLHADAKVGLRHSPIMAAVLTNGDVDHIIGLINLREAQPFTIYATNRVLDVIRTNSVFQVLAEPLVPRVEMALGKPFDLQGAGVDLGLTIEAFAVPGKVALYLEDTSSGDFGTQEGDTIGLKITDPAEKKSFFYIPGCAAIDETLAARLQGASIVFFDGTLFTDDEMIEQGLLNKTGARMGHISMSGASGSIAAFSKLGVGRLIYVHINNSNPALDENSPARKAIDGAGWEVGYDGMEVRL